MTTSSDQPGTVWAGDSIGPLLLAFRYALPHIACDGLYPVCLDRAAEQPMGVKADSSSAPRVLISMQS